MFYHIEIPTQLRNLIALTLTSLWPLILLELQLLKQKIIFPHFQRRNQKKLISPPQFWLVLRLRTRPWVWSRMKHWTSSCTSLLSGVQLSVHNSEGELSVGARGHRTPGDYKGWLSTFLMYSKIISKLFYKSLYFFYDWFLGKTFYRAGENSMTMNTQKPVMLIYSIRNFIYFL